MIELGNVPKRNTIEKFPQQITHIVNKRATLRLSLLNQQLEIYVYIFFCTASRADKFTDDIY